MSTAWSHLLPPPAQRHGGAVRADPMAAASAGADTAAAAAAAAEASGAEHNGHTAAADKASRPFVTLSFAQGLDGSIATSRRVMLPLSGSASMLMTHALRGGHDAIMVGVGTVLADDPQLTARLPQPAPKQPQPVVLDAQLKLPLSARLLKIARPWIFCNAPANTELQSKLEQAGAVVLPIPPATADSTRLDVAAVLRVLHERGIGSVMIEGGATIIGHLLQSDDLVDRLVITIAPVLVGGLRIDLEPTATAYGGGLFRRLTEVRYDVAGEDMIVSGILQRRSDMVLPPPLSLPISH